MAHTNYGYHWYSDECHKGDGNCDGYVPEDDPDAAGVECSCACHDDTYGGPFETMTEVREWHERWR